MAQANLIRHPEILAQQFAALNDPAAAAALGAVQQAAAAASAGQSQQISPYAFPAAWANGLRGAVGYQPNIIVLPTGTNMMAFGVVSADRRYVRVTCVPLFSAVTAVNSFNVGGGGGNNNGGGGAAGGGNQPLGNNPGNANGLGGGVN